MAENIKILMTGAGAPGAAGIIKCLRQMNGITIIAVDASTSVAGKYLADEFFQVPYASDPFFIDSVAALARKKKIDIIMPLVTRELLPFSINRELFRQFGTHVLVSSPHSLEIANDKSRLYQFLEWRSIAVPAFRIVENTDQFGEAVKELGYPAKPVCFKPSVSNGSRGFRIISEQMDELDLLFNHKPQSTFIRFNSALEILSSGKFPELLVSEYLPGDEYSVDCLVNNGEPLLVVPRLRKRIINGISVEGEFVPENEIITYCSQIIHELKLHGNIGIQVKKSSTGKFMLLEINPRVQGTISAALGAGVNLPVLAVKQELGMPISQNELLVNWGTKFVRYWEELFIYGQ